IVGPSGVPWTPSYVGDTDYRGGSANSADQGTSGGLGNEGPGSVTCGGQITATYVWNRDGDPNSDPPPAIVLIETASAGYSAYQGSGGCDDGPGDPAVANNGYSATSTGVHYRIISQPPTTFSTSCTPTANAGSSATWCTASVSYSVEVQPITLTLDGSIPANKTNNCLMGQDIQGHLDAGSFQIANFHWAVSGNVFQGVQWGSWYHNMQFNGDYSVSHHYVPTDAAWSEQARPKLHENYEITPDLLCCDPSPDCCC
ncbi:MAG TPA: hypothetical protein VG820_12430, partial [Fimbriimonadaceae bacterium]|nr:hypothetical protein [Fimbriimonadaceae bacterium]